MERRNRHHVLFPRKLHEAHPDTKELRKHHLLIPNLDYLGHVALHREVTIVPPLDRFTAGRVLRDFYPVRDEHVQTMEELLRSIEGAIKHPKTTELERLNAEVAIYAIAAQIPFVRDYLIKK